MSHQHKVTRKNLFITIFLNIIITLAQVIGGILSGSLALLSDALHNFSDVLALILTFIANNLSIKPHTKAKTFGYQRAEVLATFINASVLIGIGVFLIVESVNKFLNPHAISSIWVIYLGLLSIVLNAVSVLLIKNDAHDNMNIKAAYLHLLTDVMTSIAVVVGGILMYYYNLFWIDSVVSIIIALYLIWASIDLVKKSTSILMQFTPPDIKINDVVSFIKETKEIRNVHHIHVWKLDEHTIHFEAHIDFNFDITLSEGNLVLDKLEESLKTYFDQAHRRRINATRF